MDFIIFYEHISREAENILLVKEELNSRGYSVEISHFSFNGYGKNILFSKPKVVVTPWLRSDENLYRFTRFRNRPSKIVNLQWEQIYNKQDLESGLVETLDQAKDVNHICWGKASKDRLTKIGVPENKLEITGAIHLDFSREEFNHYYKSREELADEYNIPNDKKWILYVSSFAYATYSEEDIRELENQWNMSYYDMVKVSRDSRKKTLEWIEELLNKDTEVIFIYRPHPSEKIDEELIRFKNQHDNFYVIKDYSVKQWIKVCNKINTWYSTSIAEIYYMGKECSIVRPYKLLDDIEVEIMNGAKFITTKDEFIQYNLLDKSGEKYFPISKETMDYFYDFEDSIPSYVRVANYLEKVYKSEEYNTVYSFSKDDKQKYKKLYKNSILISLISDFVAKTNIKLSRIIPIKKRIFTNIENKAMANKNGIEKYENAIGKVRQK